MLLPNNPPATELEELQGLHATVLNFAYTGRRKFASAAAGLLVCIVGYHVVFGANGLTAFQAKRHETAALAQQIDAVQKENERLAIHNGRLLNDKNAIEQSIRNGLHFAKKDEVILTLPDSPATR